MSDNPWKAIVQMLRNYFALRLLMLAACVMATENEKLRIWLCLRDVAEAEIDLLRRYK